MSSFLPLSGLLCLALFVVVTEAHSFHPRLNNFTGMKVPFNTWKYLMNLKPAVPIKKQQCGSCTCCITINAPLYRCCSENCKCENSYAVYANSTNAVGTKIIQGPVGPSAVPIEISIPQGGTAPPGSVPSYVGYATAPTTTRRPIIETTTQQITTQPTPVRATTATPTAPPQQPSSIVPPPLPSGTPGTFNIGTPGTAPPSAKPVVVTNPCPCTPVATECCVTAPPPPRPCQATITTTTTTNTTTTPATTTTTTQPPCTASPNPCICNTPSSCQVRQCPTAQPCICDCTNCQPITAKPITNPPVPVVTDNYPVTPSTEQPIIIIPKLPETTTVAITTTPTNKPFPPVFPSAGPVYSACCLVSLQGANARVMCGCSSQISTPAQCESATATGVCSVNHIVSINSVNAYTSVGATISCFDAVSNGYLSWAEITSTCGSSVQFPEHPVTGTGDIITIPRGDEYTTIVVPVVPVEKDSYVNNPQNSVAAVSGLSALILAGIAVYISV